MTIRRALLLPMLLLAALGPFAGHGAAQETPRSGGVLKAAMIGEPPTLDLHWTTAVITQEIAFHIYEGLFYAASSPARTSISGTPGWRSRPLTLPSPLRGEGCEGGLSGAQHAPR